MEEDPSDEMHLLTNDLARMAGVSGAAIRAAVATGRLIPDHRTPSGVCIFHFGTGLKFAETRDRVARLKRSIKQTWKGGK